MTRGTLAGGESEGREQFVSGSPSTARERSGGRRPWGKGCLRNSGHSRRGGGRPGMRLWSIELEGLVIVGAGPAR